MKLFNRIAICVFILVISVITYKITTSFNQKIFITETPKLRNIENVIYIPGFIYPISEIEIKSQLSGVIEKLYVSIGDSISVNDPIATVNLVPNSSNIEQLEHQIKLAQIEYETQQLNYKRNKQLFELEVIPTAEMEISEKNLKIASEKLNTAKKQLHIFKQDSNRNLNENNIIRSSTQGIIIDIPIKAGTSIIERNSYNAGTTIAVLANMQRFVFRAQIVEQILIKLTKGMPIKLTINAYDTLKIISYVTKIASKGIEYSGSVKFFIDAEFTTTKDMPLLRSGFSATAEVTLEQAKNVLSIDEKYIFFEDSITYLYILDSITHEPQRRNIILGISDSKYVEIIDGLNINEKVITNYSN